MTTLATDTFVRANSSTLGANWTDIAVDFGIVSNVATAPTVAEGLTLYSGVGAFPNDQWAQVTVGATLTNGSDGVGPVVRGSGTSAANFNGYTIIATSLGSALIKVVAGANTALASSSTGFSSGDVAYLEVQGSTIVVKKNGVVVPTLGATDSSLTSGLPGMIAAAIAETVTVTAFSAGNFVTSLAGTGPITFGQSGSLTGSGALAGIAALSLAQSGAIAGKGVLIGSAALAFAQTGNIAGVGALAGTAAITFGQTGAITGAGVLNGTAGITFAATGTATVPSGALAGTATLTFNQVGALSGGGALTGSAGLTFAQTGAITGAGVLAGTAPLTLGQSGVLAGAGALNGIAALTLGQSGAITATGALAGADGFSFAATGTMTQPAGALQGTASLTFNESGLLTAIGSLSGEADFFFSANGTLIQPNVATATPGRKLRLRADIRGETEEEKRLRRIEQGILVETLERVEVAPKPDRTIERLTKQIVATRAQAQAYRASAETRAKAQAADAKLKRLDAQLLTAQTKLIQDQTEEHDIVFVASVLANL